ncbi:tripartite motif-containing protein 2-like [Pecten maximus]|uniref:tripartite motif-containing protein 2-like n=1 Tax=Pecten maximus TaxID=6579 RepID=UPI001458BC91|nr:tripartite motif-containing protein 2-like [Pecten maximus]
MASGNAVPRAQLHIRAKGNTKCKDHSENDVIFLCQNCKTLICPTCSISIHKSHIDSFVEISKIETENKNAIQFFLNETDNVNIPKLNQEIISSRTKMSSYKPLYNNLRKKIIYNNNQCKLELDKITDVYIKFCDKMEVAAMDLIQTHITNLEERLDTLKQLSSEYKQTLQTGNAVLVYDSVSEIREMDPDIPPTPNIDMAEFTPGMARLSHLKQAIGNLKSPTDHLQTELATGGHSDQCPVVRPKQSTETGQASTGEVQYKLRDRPTVMSQFSYPDNIRWICPTSDGRAWLCDCRHLHTKARQQPRSGHTDDTTPQ